MEEEMEREEGEMEEWGAAYSIVPSPSAPRGGAGATPGPTADFW
jgi:hypothetical protein